MSGGRLFILGASGHGKVVGDCAMAAAGWADIRFFDDRWPMLGGCGPWPVVGTGEAFFAEAGAGGRPSWPLAMQPFGWPGYAVLRPPGSRLQR